jgi:small basic protein
MNSLYALTFFTHTGLGTLALATFWIAGLSRKGSPVHRTAGKVYLLAMTGLLVAAVPLAIGVLQRFPVGGAFLFYLLVIVTTSMWTSWRALRDKRDWKRYTGPVFRGLMWANLASAIAIAAVGLFVAKQMQLIIVAFAGIGLFAFVQMRRFQRQPPEDPRWWLREHFTAMLGNGVATHIAFLSIGLPKVLPMLAGPTLQNLAWLGPLVVAFLAGTWLTRKYLPKRPAPQPQRQTVAG